MAAFTRDWALQVLDMVAAGRGWPEDRAAALREAIGGLDGWDGDDEARGDALAAAAELVVAEAADLEGAEKLANAYASAALQAGSAAAADAQSAVLNQVWGAVVASAEDLRAIGSTAGDAAEAATTTLQTVGASKWLIGGIVAAAVLGAAARLLSSARS